MLEEMLATHSTATTSFEDSDSGSSLVDLEAAKDIDTLQTAETVAVMAKFESFNRAVLNISFVFILLP